MSTTENVHERLWRLRKRLAAGTLFAALLVTPMLWLTANTMVGDFLTGVWVGTLAAFVMVAGPLVVPERPALSRFLSIVAVLAVGGAVLWISPTGPGAGPERANPGAALIVFMVGALAAHGSWAAQINRVSRRFQE